MQLVRHAAFVAGLSAGLVALAGGGAASYAAPSRYQDQRIVEVRLEVAPGKLALLPGKPADVFAFNGRVPGPTIEVTEGDRLIVHIRNRLSDSTTVHWHGFHVPADADGSPLHPIPPGTERTVKFDIPAGSAGTYWYHPHPHHVTGYQVAMGLYGAIIVRAANDPLPPMKEQLIILADNRFREDGAVDIQAPHAPWPVADRENGREGNIIFVNGEVNPTITIRRGETQRWRIVNASAARVYRLALQGHTFLHVGSDGGLFEIPIDTSEILIANAERVELLVRGTGGPGSTATLQSLPYDRYIPQTRPADWKAPRDLLTVRYSTAPAVEPIALPARLRHVEWIDTTSVTARRSIVFMQGLINGKRMDHARVDVESPLGATEIWTVENVVGMDHPFHLHGFQFQVLDRNGVPERYAAWKDVVNVPKHEHARFVVRFDHFPGKWMFHCHILDHEDRGMMGILAVTTTEAP